jgi:hypothetical protein
MGYNVTGYGSRNNLTRPFGGPENIVMLFDGACGSSCTLFAQAMKWDAGVKSIAMGGRPETKGLIQGTGGVKGSRQYNFGHILEHTNAARQLTHDSEITAKLDRYQPYVLRRTSGTGLNVRDALLPQDWQSGTPAQFVNEFADCRLYWQAGMHLDIRQLWRSAAQVAFKGGRCTYGSVS